VDSHNGLMMWTISPETTRGQGTPAGGGASEPHSGGSRPESRKGKPPHGLQIIHFPHVTQRNPQNPQIPGGFLQFPALRNTCFVHGCPVCSRAVRCVGRWDE